MTENDNSAGAGRDDGFCEHLIAFRGSMVTAATHEFQNHLAVIKEYNGLIRDLLQTRKPDRKTIKRCVEISGSIEERARVAAGSIDSLNHFAHRGDSATSRFKVGDVVAELVALLGRYASQDRVTLEFHSTGDGPEISNNPVLLQYLVYLLVQPLIVAVGIDGRITISVDAGPGPAAQTRIVAASVNPIAPTEVEYPDIFESCLRKLGAAVSGVRSTPERREIVLEVGSISAC